ncbi:DUF6271 family protein [Streptomyces sp. LP05-1]|uniref:DUF6271 family protein n=1 Tax=Streptomyces pyxinae TaxID=2970734 RepID=A0ABT2CDP9_9ACTN|nr:DUF6271 family protein [Streptomyces sp. LP05-1]MCS0635540.1 DUF6271 family protein [Streptomyces sp. LP05-1]
MSRICLTLPTNRPCAEAITALGEEAVYAAERFGAEVCLLVLDSCEPPEYERHAAAVRELPGHPGVTAYHLDETAQRDFLKRVVDRTGAPGPGRLLDLMLPDALSYGACTNRAFLLAAALGCESVHRRDSDSRYQTGPDGRPVFPVHHELAAIGRRAADAAPAVTETALDPAHPDRPVAMVGASFIGELSVDIGEIRALDPDTYREVVGLWAPAHWSAEQRRELADDSFAGAGTEPFTEDHSLLTVVDPMRVDMCNIAFHGVQEHIPLLPATDTIGSDYFLIHVVHKAGLPGVLHNRHIVNHYTGERRTDAGFPAYQTRFTKFLLSMLHLHPVYDRMTAAGPGLLDERHRPRPELVAAFARESAAVDRAENVRRLDVLDAAYRRLGGRYATFADRLAPRRALLLDAARRDIEDFALLTDVWRSLIEAARHTTVAPAR